MANLKRFLNPLAVASMAGWVGCTSMQKSEMPNAAQHRVANVYHAVNKLPLEVRRVAVLPIAVDEQSPDAVAGRDAFGSVLLEELLQTHEFEAVPIPMSQLRRWFGKQTFGADERLPAELLQRVEADTGCDAVLLTRLTAYRPYPPVLEGWNLRLVWSKSTEILWGVDDIFDASDTEVAAAARKQFKTQEAVSVAAADPSAALTSPRRIAQYALRSVLRTMPKH
ncbi:MAG TPA: hypothetical protein VMF06_03560 [Candidatus Limnocylindria bacterium]|jgi:hypothetical protein|nr:hypothetical protein [Candidatus Limnocylindria bacterium]